MSPINFPASPSDGDVYGNFTYSASVPGWRKTPENAASLPAGTIVQWPGATAPANWLICDGAAVSRTTYSSLFASIGVQYGSGDGSTTFNLPNLKGKVAVGFDGSQTEFNTLGKTGGAKTHTLTEAEMPSHTHTGTTSSNGSHTHIVTVGGGAHTHALPLGQQAGQNANDIAYRSGTSNGYDGAFRTGFEAASSSYNSAMGTHTHTTSVSTDGAHTHTFTTGATGSGAAHNNLQPYIVLNYIIKTSAGVTSGDSELATRVGVVEAANNATPLSPNYIINGGFDIWQRGTSFVGTSYNYSADRWIIVRGGFATGYTATRQTATGLTGFQYCIRAQRDSGNTGLTDFGFSTALETSQSILLAGKTVTLSFYARKGANYSATNSQITTYIHSGTGTDQAASGMSWNWTGGTNSVATHTLTTSWARYTHTFTLPSSMTQTGVGFVGVPTGTAGAADHYEVTGVQLEEGSYATPFRRNAPSIQAELAACQRYYWRMNAENSYGVFGFAAGNGANAWMPVQLPVQMRTAPSTTPEWSGDFSKLNFLLGGSATSLVYAGDGISSRMVNITFSGSGFASATTVRAGNASNVYFGFSAEL